MGSTVERRQTAVPSIAEQRRRAGDLSPLDVRRPPRRRRSALLGGGLLIASSPVTVGAGLFVVGFTALGVGMLLLLVPPRPAGRHRGSLRVVRVSTAGGRAMVALGRGTARTGASTFWAVERFAADNGRVGAARVGAATSEGAVVIGRSASAAGSRSWSEVQVWAPRAWRALVAATRRLSLEAHSASIRLWIRAQPLLRRAWAACRAGVTAAAERLAVLARLASERLSAYLESRSPPR
jgi:hypothetical protein